MKQKLNENQESATVQSAKQNAPTETHATKTEKPTAVAPQTGGVSSPVICSAGSGVSDKQIPKNSMISSLLSLYGFSSSVASQGFDEGSPPSRRSQNRPVTRKPYERRPSTPAHKQPAISDQGEHLYKEAYLEQPPPERVISLRLRKLILGPLPSLENLCECNEEPLEWIEKCSTCGKNVDWVRWLKPEMDLFKMSDLPRIAELLFTKESSNYLAATAGQNVQTETHATKTPSGPGQPAQTGGVSSPVFCSAASGALNSSSQ